MLLFEPIIIFLTTYIYILFSPLIGKKVFYFTTCATRLVTIKKITKGCLNYFIEFIKTISTFLLIIPPPIIIETEGIGHVNT